MLLLQSLNENVGVVAILLGGIGALWFAFKVEYNGRIKAIESAKAEIIAAKQEEIEHYRNNQTILQDKIEELERERFKMFAEMKITFDAAIDAIKLLDGGKR